MIEIVVSSAEDATDLINHALATGNDVTVRVR